MNFITLVNKFIMNLINLVIGNSVLILRKIFVGGREIFCNYIHVLVSWGNFN